MIAVRRSSPGRMRNPASNARSNLPGMVSPHSSKTRERGEQTPMSRRVRRCRCVCRRGRSQGVEGEVEVDLSLDLDLLEDSPDRGITVEDGYAALLQSVGAADAE